MNANSYKIDHYSAQSSVKLMASHMMDLHMPIHVTNYTLSMHSLLKSIHPITNRSTGSLGCPYHGEKVMDIMFLEAFGEEHGSCL